MRKVHKRLLSLFIAVVMIFSTMATAFAADSFRVFMPKSLEISIDKQGNLKLPDDSLQRIYNMAESESIQVKSVKILPQNGWELEAFDSDFKNMKSGTKAFGLKIRGESFSEGLNLISNPENWRVEAQKYLDLNLEAKIAPQAKANAGVVIAKLVFDLDWAAEKSEYFRVNFKDNQHGIVTDKSEIMLREPFELPALPDVKLDEGFEFVHYIDQDMQAVKPGDVIAKDVILTPVVIEKPVESAPEKFVISFEDGEGGTIADKTPIEVTDGIVPELPEVTPNEGFEFKGWVDEDKQPVKPGDEIKSDKTLTPVFEAVETPVEPDPVPEKFVISFEDGEGGTIADKTPIEVTDGIVPELPEVTPDEGYEFKGWVDADNQPVKPGDELKSDVTLTPVFEAVEKPVEPDPEPEKFVISFEDGENGEIADKTPVEVTDSIVPELPEVTPSEGFEFKGWVDGDNQPVKPGDEIKSDITLTPVFEAVEKPVEPDPVPEKFVIDFEDAEGGEIADKTPIEVTDGTVPELPEVTPSEGFEFKGWVDENGNPVKPGDEILADMTLRPVFEETKVVVTFTASQYNGELVGNADFVPVTYGTKWSDVVKPDTKAGLSATFMGWMYADELIADDFVITEDITVVAEFMSWFTHADVEIAFGSSLHAVTGFSEAYEKAGKPVDIVIPNKIDGKSVTGISRGAFAEQTHLESVDVQEGFKEFDQYAFYRCTSMTDFNIPNSLEHLGAYAFKESGVSGVITLSDNLVYAGGCVFSHCDNLEGISIPGTIRIDGTDYNGVPYGFAEYCANLRKAEVRDGAKKTMVGVFRGCKALTDLVLPASLTEIQNYFVGSSGDDTACESLAYIHFRGTYSQWNSIKVVYNSSILVAGNNAMLKEASLGCQWSGSFDKL